MRASVIIPIYNTKDYIHECIQSLCDQSFRNFEVILVDDGSTDGSYETIKKFIAERGDNMQPALRLYKQKNQGLSAARNLGLKKARGEYILFIDSDDFVAKNYVELMTKDMHSASTNIMRICGYNVHRLDCNEKRIPRSNINVKNFRFIMYAKIAIGGACWNKVYKRQVIKENNILFNTDLQNCEDMLFNAEYAQFVDGFEIISAAPYFYRQRQGSITNDGYSKKCLDALESASMMRKLPKSSKLDVQTSKYMKFEYSSVIGQNTVTIKNSLGFFRFILDYRIPVLRRVKTVLRTFLRRHTNIQGTQK